MAPPGAPEVEIERMPAGDPPPEGGRGEDLDHGPEVEWLPGTELRCGHRPEATGGTARDGGGWSGVAALPRGWALRAGPAAGVLLVAGGTLDVAEELEELVVARIAGRAAVVDEELEPDLAGAPAEDRAVR